MRLYSRMVNAAANSYGKAALQKLQESTLKEKLVQGAREKWAKRELRRIEISCRQKTFSVMQEEMLDFFRDQEPSGKAARAFEAIAEAASVPLMQTSMKGEIEVVLNMP